MVRTVGDRCVSRRALLGAIPVAALAQARLMRPADTVAVTPTGRTLDAFKDLGLKCDGVTNDAPALQYAIAGLRGNCTVNFPDGCTCGIAGLVIGDGGPGRQSSYHNVQLVGAGPGGAWATEIGVNSANSTLVYPASVAPGQTMVRFAGPISACSLQGLRIEGNGRAQHLIWATSLYEGLFDRLVAMDCPDYAVFYDSNLGAGGPGTMRTVMRDCQVWAGGGCVRVGNLADVSECCSNRWYNCEFNSGTVGNVHAFVFELADDNALFGCNIGPLNLTPLSHIEVHGGVATVYCQQPHQMTRPDNVFIQGTFATPGAVVGNFDVTPTGPSTVTFAVNQCAAVYPPACDGTFQATAMSCSTYHIRRGWQNMAFGLMSGCGISWTEPTPAELGPSLLYQDGNLNSHNSIFGLAEWEMGGGMSTGGATAYCKPGRITVITDKGDVYNCQNVGAVGSLPTYSLPLVNPALTSVASGWQKSAGWSQAPAGIQCQAAGCWLYQALPCTPQSTYSFGAGLVGSGYVQIVFWDAAGNTIDTEACNSVSQSRSVMATAPVNATHVCVAVVSQGPLQVIAAGPVMSN